MNQAVFEKGSKEYLDFCYGEYLRLSKIYESQLNSATSDFKLLGAIGFLIGWKPLMNALAERDNFLVLTLGFIAILMVALIILLFNFMKQSIMLFYVNEMKYYEEVIRELLPEGETRLLNSVRHWSLWMDEVQQPAVIRFFGLFFSFLILFPTGVLLLSDQWSKTYPFALTYIVISIVFCGVATQGLHTITEKITAHLKAD